MANEIPLTRYDIGNRKINGNEDLPKFKGRNGQLVIDISDNYRIVVMDGSKLGGVSKVALLNSAPFTTNPTVNPTEDLDSLKQLPDNAVVPKKDVETIAETAIKEKGLSCLLGSDDSILDDIKENVLYIVYEDK